MTDINPISWYYDPLPIRREKIAKSLSKMHKLYSNRLATFTDNVAIDLDRINVSSILKGKVDEWGCSNSQVIECPTYVTELTELKTINSLYPETRLNNVGYVSQFGDYPKTALELRAAFYITNVYSHLLWSEERILDLEYRMRLIDSSIISGKNHLNLTSRYMAKFCEFLKPISFTRDYALMEILFGFKYTAPTLSLDMTPAEMARNKLYDATAMTKNMLACDHHWFTMDVDTKALYLSDELLFWIWIHRGWLSTKNRNFVEDSPHFIIPDIILPPVDNYPDSLSEHELMLFTELTVGVGAKKASKSTKAKVSKKTEALSFMKGDVKTTVVNNDLFSEKNTVLLNQFIGNVNGDVRIGMGKQVLPFYIEKKRSVPGSGYFATIEVLKKMESTVEKDGPVTLLPHLSIGFPKIIVDQGSPLHISRFDEIIKESYDESGRPKLIIDTIPLLKVYQAHLPLELQPAKERIFPHTPKVNDPFVRRWRITLKDYQDTPFFYIPIPIWNSKIEVTQTKLDGLIKFDTSRYDSNKLAKHYDRIAKVQGDLLAIDKVDPTTFLKKIPTSMRQYINALSKTWHLRALNAIERVIDTKTANYVFIYLRALFDEHERLEQYLARNIFLNTLQSEILTNTLQLSMNDISVRKCTAYILSSYDIEDLPKPPIIPEMYPGEKPKTDMTIRTVDGVLDVNVFKTEDNKARNKCLFDMNVDEE